MKFSKLDDFMISDDFDGRLFSNFTNTKNKIQSF